MFLPLYREYMSRMKNAKGYPETHHPHIPDILKHTTHFKKYEDKEYNSSIGVTLAEEGAKLANQKFLDIINTFFPRRYSDGVDGFEQFPSHTLAFSMPEMNFQLRSSCHDFEPISEYHPYKGFFTYKMLAENVQAVYFNDENGQKFLAGTTYYMTPAGSFMPHPATVENILRLEYLMAEPYPLRNLAHNSSFVRYKKYGRYCETAKARVLVWTGKEDGEIVHQSFNPITGIINDVGCVECAKHFREYKFEVKVHEHDVKSDVSPLQEADDDFEIIAFSEVSKSG